MKVLGLVTEYNPFHNGHKYHLLKSKEITGATHTIAVMSGNFLQRGDPSLFNKWIRAEMAVREGVDLVLELPTLYACSSAEFFAFGSISLLNKLNMVDDLCFGSESGDIKVLEDIAKVLATEPSSYKDSLKKNLSFGLSYPVARSKALQEYFSNEEIVKIAGSSNNILGIEYLKAIIRTKSSIIPHTIDRIKADYHSKEITGDICSATAIRASLYSHNSLEPLKKVMPKDSFEVLSNAIKQGLGPVFLEDFEQAILFILRSSSTESLMRIMDLKEGLENRIKAAAIKAGDLKSFYDLVETKRYTSTRIKRIIIHALLNISKGHYDIFNSLDGSQYARVLGFNKKGAEILKQLKKTSQVPIITNLTKQFPQEVSIKELLSKDIEAADLYCLGYPHKKNRSGASEYIMNPYINF